MIEKKRYSKKELQEFKEIILSKLDKVKKEIKFYQEKLKELNENLCKIKTQNLENSPEVEERENINYQIRRIENFGKKLIAALHRIEKGTYGICAITDNLISKERLRIVPHATLSVQAKESRLDD